MTEPVIGVAFISDRDPSKYLNTAVRTFHEHVATAPWGITGQFIVDDRRHELGMAGAVRKAWEWADRYGLTHLWHVEEDFEFVQDVDTRLLVELLDRSPYLASVTLTRALWSPEEHDAGHLATIAPNRSAEMLAPGGGRWIRHRNLFSLNPSLIPRRTFARWDDRYPAGPLGVGNEAGATARLVDEGMSFALWGGRDDPPQVVHTGVERGSGWRL